MAISDGEINAELDRLKQHVKEKFWDRGVQGKAAIIEGLETEQYLTSPAMLEQVIDELNKVTVHEPVQIPENKLTEAPTSVQIGQVEAAQTAAPTPPVEPLKMPEMIQPPRAQIDDLMKQGYSNRQIEEIMKLNFHKTYRPIINERRHLLKTPVEATGAVSENTANPPAEPPIVAQQTAQAPEPTLEQAIASLKSEHGIDFTRGGSSLSTPAPISPQEQALRIKNFNAMLTAMKKTGQPYDPSMLAASLGYFDIAEQIKHASSQGQLTQLLQTFAVQGTPDSPAAPTVVGTGASSMLSSFEAMLNKAMEMQMMSKIMGPILQQMQNTGNSGGTPQIDKYEIQKMLEEQMRKIQGDPEIRALREQINRLETNGGKNSETELLKFKLEMLQNDKTRDAGNDQLRMFKDLTTSTGQNVTQLTEKIQAIQAENDRQREADRQRYELQLQANQQRERDSYAERLKDVEARLDKAMSGGGSNSWIEQYQATRTVVEDEIKRLDSLRGDKGGSNVPEILMNVAKEFAPAATEYMKIRAGNPTPTAAPGPPGVARQGAQAGMLQGQCPWCNEAISVPDADQVPCPKCGRFIYPHGAPPQQVTQPQAPIGPMAPEPIVVPVTPQPGITGDKRPYMPYDNPVQNGQVVRPRRPDEVVLA